MTEELPKNSESTTGIVDYTAHESCQSELCSSCSDSNYGYDFDSGDLGEEQTEASNIEALEARVKYDIWEEDHTPENKGSSCGTATDM